MIFLCFALKFEAEPFIDYFELKKEHNINNFRVYKNEHIAAVITGTGIINAVEGLSNLFVRYYNDKNDIFINIGIAGGSKKHKLGDIVIINKIKGINNDEYFTDVNTNPFKETDLKTILRKDINNNFHEEDLVDLEGEAYYRVAQKYVFQNNIHIIKIISDYKEDRELSREFLCKLLKDSSKDIIEYIKNLMKNYALNKKSVKFSVKEEKLIKKISKNYVLSEYLKKDFEKKALNYKIRGNNLIKLLGCFSNIKAENKKDRRKKYNELTERLEVLKN